MESVIKVSFPGGESVTANLGSLVIPTEQAPDDGSPGQAPEPFQLFLASIATCAGYYALSFCQGRGIDPEGLELAMISRRHATEPRYDLISLKLKVPADFPEKYRVGIARAMDLCAVKKHILQPPEFEISVD